MNRVSGTPSAPAGESSAARLGYYAAILTAALTVVTFVIAFLTPPLSGPNCTAASCYEYPYLDIAARFPRDYWWMFPAMILTLAYLALMACIHHTASERKRTLSLIGLCCAVIAAGTLILDYFVQVSVIQPSLENGETEGIALLTQFNPHGIFIVLEEMGYLMMSVSFLFVAPVFTGVNRTEHAIRWVFIAGFVLAVIALIGTSLAYGTDREYRFEVFVISIDWVVLIVTGILLSIVFRRAMRTS